MTPAPSLSGKADALVERLGLSYDHLLGVRFAINVFIATTIIWIPFKLIGGGSPIWAIASMVAAADPEPEEARRMFRCRLSNVLVGCATGLGMLLTAGRSDWVIAFGLAVAVLISAYVVRIKTMWRQAPITAAIVIATGISSGFSEEVGLQAGLRKVAQVLFGCIVGVLVSWLMSKLWLVRPPAERATST